MKVEVKYGGHTVYYFDDLSHPLAATSRRKYEWEKHGSYTALRGGPFWLAL